MSKTIAKRSKKDEEVDRFSRAMMSAADVLGKAMAEARDLQKVNLAVNTQRVNTWHALSAERESLIARIHAIDHLIVTLGMNGPATENQANRPGQ